MQEPTMKKVGRGAKAHFVCALDGCGEPLNEITVKNGDPFHHTECARAYYGIPLPKPQRGVTVASSS